MFRLMGRKGGGPVFKEFPQGKGETHVEVVALIVSSMNEGV